MDENTFKYQHTQIGYLILSFLFIFIVFFTWLYRVISTEIDFNFAIVVIMAIILLILVSFSSLTITIDKDYLQIKFGYGIFQKQFLLNEINSARSVKNHWYYGWGIRYWFWPRMWIFNISGFDAVEIIMKNGKIYRIGTDVPRELESIIKENI